MGSVGKLTTKVLEGVGKAAGGFVGGSAALATDAVVGITTGAVKGTGAIAKGFGSGAKKGFGTLLNKNIKNTGRKAGDAASKAVGEVEEKVGKAASDIGEKAKKAGGKLKEARVSQNKDVTNEAIQKVTYSREKDKYYRQVEGGRRQEIDSKMYGKANSRRISNDRASTPSHKNYTGDNYSNTFTMEEEIADDIAKTGAGDGAGIDLLQFASDHPVGTALAGLGVGVVGANLFDSDN